VQRSRTGSAARNRENSPVRIPPGHRGQ